MAKSKSIIISDFSPGLQTLADPAELSVGAAQVCQDVMLDRGDLRVRDGRVIHIASPAHLTTNIRAISELFLADHSPTHRFVAVNATKIYWNVNNTTARVWGTAQTIAQGQFRRALTNTPAGATSYVYEATTVAGSAPYTTSATTEPTWPIVAGNTVVDNEVTWTCRNMESPWTTLTAYVVGQFARPTTVNTYFYECTTAGTSAVAEPSWGTTAGGTTADGTVVWTCRATPNASYWDEIDSTVAVHATNDISFQDFGGFLYLADGSNWIREISADGVVTTLTDFPGPKTAPTIVPSVSDLRLDDCDNTGAATISSAYYTQGSDADGGWHNNTHTDQIWHTFNNPDNADTGDVDRIYAYAQTAVVYDGDNLSTSRTHSMSLFADADNGHTPRLNCGDVYLMRELPPPRTTNKLPTRYTGYDLTDATRINFSMYVEAGEMLGTAGGTCNFYLVLGEDETVSGWQKVQITTDAAGTALASLAINAWHDFSVDITGLTNANINAVTWAGFYFENLDTIPYDNPLGAGFDYIRVTFSPIRVNMSAASFVQDTYEFTYTFYDTSITEESSEYINTKNLATPYPSFDVNYNIPQALIISCTRPIGSAANTGYVYARGGVNAGDMKRIGTVNFDTVGNNTAVRTASVEWQGDYPSGEPTLGQYVGRPPKGCTYLTSYRNRLILSGRLPRLDWSASTVIDIGVDVVPLTRNGLVYICTVVAGDASTGATEPTWGTTVGGTTTDNNVTWTCYTQDAADVLYYSNYGDPTRVATVPFSLATMPANQGGWIDTERHGDNISGLLGAGMFLYAWKKQGIWRGKGDPGITGDSLDAFFLGQLHTTEGCVSPQSVCRVENRVCWQGVDKILSISASEDKPVSLTDAILPTMQAYSATNQGNAWSLYDPASKRFYMFYSTGSDVAAPDSECLMLQLKAGGWTQFTAQPGACGIYSAFAGTPGVYMADAYGASGRGKTFRLSSAAVTDAISYGAAAAISWQWVSGAIIPFGGYYCQVDAVRGSLVMADTASVYTLACTLWLNNDDARTRTRNLTVTRKIGFGDESQGTGLVDWTLAPHGEVEGVALKLARNDANIVAVRSVTLVLRPIAPVRGRTVARG